MSKYSIFIWNINTVCY